ncbi:PIN domain-containing protein [Candidatus Woesearchaeota archaeon]|nr:PIN domain-containing protein [Candidatus Woesearchaeota archaeon]
MTKYFFDSYALVEYFKGNPEMAELIENNEGVLTLLNVLEVAYIISRDFKPELGRKVIKQLNDLLVIPTSKDVEETVMFRLQSRKLDLSYADALGYTYAKRRNILFLTGDGAFEGMQNVEFVGKSKAGQ